LPIKQKLGWFILKMIVGKSLFIEAGGDSFFDTFTKKRVYASQSKVKNIGINL